MIPVNKYLTMKPSRNIYDFFLPLKFTNITPEIRNLPGLWGKESIF